MVSATERCHQLHRSPISLSTRRARSSTPRRIQSAPGTSPRSSVTYEDEFWRKGVTETTRNAWYKGSGGLHPWKGETEPEYTDFQENGKYSWVKAPRFEGRPAQVGPLANVLCGYAAGNPLMKKWTDAALDKISAIAKVKATPAMLHSTLGRHGARAVRTAVLSELALKQCSSSRHVECHEDPQSATVPEGGDRGWASMNARARSPWSSRRRQVKTTSRRTETLNPVARRQRRSRAVRSLAVRNPIAEATSLEVLRTIHSFDRFRLRGHSWIRAVERSHAFSCCRRQCSLAIFGIGSPPGRRRV